MLLKKQNDYKTNVKRFSDDEDEGEMKSNISSGREHISLPLSLSMSRKDSKDGYDVFTKTKKMGDHDRAKTSLCDLPYSVTQSLMRSMDADRGWESLAAAAGYTFDRIQLLSLKQQQADGSPTRSLLWDLGCRSYKVSDLHEKLQSVSRIREMQILEVYVKGSDQDEKSAGLAKKSSSNELPSLLSQLKPDLKEQTSGESGFNSSGSEVNFNKPSLVSKSNSKVGGAKHYDDKVIPGTQPPAQAGATSSSSGENQDLAQSLSASFAQGLSSFQLPQRLQPTESSDSMPCSSSEHKSLASSFPISGAGSPSTTTGADTLSRMMSSNSPKPSLMGSQDSSTPQRFTQSPGQHSPQSLLGRPSLQGTGQKGYPSCNGISPLPSFNSQRSDGSTSSTESDMAVAVRASFSYTELAEATQGFSDVNFLGEGNFGRVYKGSLRGLECAVKQLKAKPDDHSDKLSQVKAELTALLKYQHENILTLYGYALDGPEMCLVYQFLTNGSLEDRLALKHGTPALNWERRLNILMGMCKGINFLHTMGDKALIHGDIKSANILLDKYYEAKIADLGQAKYATSSSTESKGFTHITIADSSTKQFSTRAYQAPEICNNISLASLSIKSDIYALGVVFLEVCSGLKAHDLNRCSFSFLADFFLQHVSTFDKSQWIELFKDKNLYIEDFDNTSFYSVLEQATKCLNRVKKQRPDSVKLLQQITNIYREKQTKTEYYSMPLRTSLMGTCTSERSQNISPISGLNSFIGPSYVSSKLEHEQEEKLRSYHQMRQSPDPSQASRGKDPMSQKESIPPEVPIPFMLQVAYDSQPKPESPEQSFASHITGNNIPSFNGSPMFHRINPANTVDQISFEIPKPDPLKQAKLDLFDRHNFSSPGEEDSNCLECDPAKIAYLRDFDGDAFKNQPQAAKPQQSTQNSTPGSLNPNNTPNEKVHYPPQLETSKHLPSGVSIQNGSFLSTHSDVSTSSEKSKCSEGKAKMIDFLSAYNELSKKL